MNSIRIKTKTHILALLTLVIILGSLFLYIVPDPINVFRHEEIIIYDKEIVLPLVKNPGQGNIFKLS